MTLRQGLATSTNLITARVMDKVKPALVCEWAYKLGIQTQLDCVPSLALGTTDLSVFELVGAYCSFVNKGVWNEPIFVTRIEDSNGNLIEEFSGRSQQAITENTAYMMLDMLQGVVNEPGGTAGRLRFAYKINHPIGGKTGTTQNQSDGWFVGVTPFLVSGAWVGCAERTMRFRTLESGQGAAMALPIWGIYMDKVYKDPELNFPTTGFVKPKGFKVELDCKKYELLKKKVSEEDGDEKSFSNPD
jgi:penicillin-binding protein 1A